jgi:hypothetical protein
MPSRMVAERNASDGKNFEDEYISYCPNCGCKMSTEELEER